MIKVIWKIIPGFENYMVSNFGDVKSLNYRRSKKERLMILYLGEKGYYSIHLYRDNKRYGFDVHVLVAMAFLGHVPCGHELVVDHINTINTDNRVENLRVITQRRNSDKTRSKDGNKYTGVCLTKYKKWQSTIVFEKRQVHLGKFSTEIEASNAYQKALAEIEDGTYKPHPLRVIKGVIKPKGRNKWVAYFSIKGKYNFIGSFFTEEEAIKARHMKLLEISELTEKSSVRSDLDKDIVTRQ